MVDLGALPETCPEICDAEACSAAPKGLLACGRLAEVACVGAFVLLAGVFGLGGGLGGVEIDCA